MRCQSDPSGTVFSPDSGADCHHLRVSDGERNRGRDSGPDHSFVHHQRYRGKNCRCDSGGTTPSTHYPDSSQNSGDSTSTVP